MLTLLFLALVQQYDGPQFPAHVEVRGPDGYEFAAQIRGDETLLVLPTITTNARAPRLTPARRSLGVRIASPAGIALTVEHVRLQALEHAAQEHVLRVAGEPALFSAPRLPAFVHTGEEDRNRLPELARYDLECVVGGELRISPERDPGEILVLLGEARAGQLTHDGQSYALDSDPLEALILEGNGALSLRGEARIDQLYYARRLPLDPADRIACAATRAWDSHGARWRWTRRQGRGPRQLLARADDLGLRERDAPNAPFSVEAGELLELRFEAPPPPPPGRVYSYVLELRCTRELTSWTRPRTSTKEQAAPYFVDRSRAAGLDGVHFEGPHDQRDIRPTMGPGAAWGDVDGDGWHDLLLVQGGGRAGCERPRDRLYRNVGGHFEELATLDDGAGMGALFFDLEGDGDLDLYVANYGADRLYQNDGSGEFTDVSATQGIGGELWSAGLCAGDTDGDGDLELYVTSYLDYDPVLMPPVEKLGRLRREDPIEMLPFAFPGQRNTFYDNRDGHLVDVTEARGLLNSDGRGMQAVFWDFDRDGALDLYVANDVSYNVLWRGDGAGNFEDISFQTGMDDPRGGMGVALGDVDGDGDEDLFLTNWQLDANALYLNNHVASSARKAHVGTFQDGTVRSRLGPAGVGVTSWGAVLFDADNDGDLDLFIPNGYTSPDYESTGICVGQPNQFFLNDGEGRFEDRSPEAGPDVTCELASRAVAVCDYDRDGRLDLLVTSNNGPYQLLHNEMSGGGHWLGLGLRARGKNPFAVGARVELAAGDLELSRTLTAGEGYLAGNAAELHFGLGANTTVDSLTVHWPSGRTTRHAISEVDRWLTVEEPE